MTSNFLKFLFFSVPVFFGFSCSSDDESEDDYPVGKWSPVIWEYDGAEYKSVFTIQVPNSGGEYKLKCKNYNPWIVESIVTLDTANAPVNFHLLGKITNGHVYEVGRGIADSDTLCPANSADDICDWLQYVMSNKSKEYTVIVSENNGSARSAMIHFSVGDVGSYVEVVQEGQ